MKAHLLRKILREADTISECLLLDEIKLPVIGDEEIMIKVESCGICHTDLDEIEGRLIPSKLPIVLGHQIVGIVKEKGKFVKAFEIGDRVGIGWINKACGCCYFCKNGYENLCYNFVATGKDVDGGYTEYTKVHEKYAFKIPNNFDSYTAAPLMCAGGVGFRSLKLASIKNGQSLALTGFGASGHLVLQVAKYLYPDSEIFVFARSKEQRELAITLGATAAFDYVYDFKEKVHAVIDTTPVWHTIVHALAILERGGRLVINAIRKEDIDKAILQNVNYETHLWQEKVIKSVANVTKKDIEEFLHIASMIPIKPSIEIYSFEELTKALVELKSGKIKGAKVLKVN
jgi:propanol-preferring alcohol dehydrogenase